MKPRFALRIRIRAGALAALSLLALAAHERFGGRLAITGGTREPVEASR